MGAVTRCVLAVMLAGQAAQAQPSSEPRLDLLQTCLEGETTQGRAGMAICAREGGQDADRRIGALLREAGSPALGLRARGLAAAQSHWRQYRGLHCRHHGHLARAPGQAAADIALCRFRLALYRESELRRLIYAMGPR